MLFPFSLLQKGLFNLSTGILEGSVEYKVVQATLLPEVKNGDSPCHLRQQARLGSLAEGMWKQKVGG